MTDNLLLLDQPKHEHLVDLFCGCGGSGGGILDACDRLGRRVQGHFVNHWDKAIEIHAANHPEHKHYREDLFHMDPTAVFPTNTFCSLLWCSPSCTFFSLARGAACVNEQERSHAHSVVDWIKHLRPEGVILENVKEWLDWGPVIQARDKYGELMWSIKRKPSREIPADDRRAAEETEEAWAERMLSKGYERYQVPDKSRKGEYFREWLASVTSLGYTAEHRILCSADYGDPTIRKRLFLQLCRTDTGKRVVWPAPTHAQKPTGSLLPWRTAREIIDWSLKGNSVFSRKKRLASNTFRRLAIGLVKYGLRDFLEGNPGEPGAYVVPHHAGWAENTVRDIDKPVSTITTTMRGEGIAQPSIVQMKGQSTAQSVDEPLTSITTQPAHYIAEPLIDHMRRTGAAKTADHPVPAITAGGRHQAIAEAFMMSIDQTGGGRNHGTYSADEPVRTVVTKANAACIQCDLEDVGEKFLAACKIKGVDTSRAETFLSHLVTELRRKGRVDAKPWVYVYYSSGSEGAPLDHPLPTVRTKAGHAICYPVIELNGKYLKIDLLYRMFTPLELQRAMGFSDDINWAGANAEQKVKAIGNSVSHGVARALALAWYTQEENISPHLKDEQNARN